MEEREKLCRQIRLLQGLINDHKNTHGDAPRPPPSTLPRWTNPRQPPFSRRGTFSTRYPQQAPRDFQPQQSHSWKKKYSLVNHPPGSVCDGGSGGSASTSRVFGSFEDNQAPELAESSSPERHVDLTRDGNIVVGIQLPQRAGPFVKTEGFANGGSCCEFSGLQTVVGAAGGDGRNMPKPLSRSQNEERRPSLSVSFSSSQRFAHLPGDSSFVTCGSSSENAVTLKSEPQQHPVAVPGHAPPSGHLGRRQAEPPASGQPSCEQVRGGFREPKLFGSGEIGSRGPQAANLVVGMTAAKSRFSVAPKAPSLQRAASTSISSKSPKFRKTNYTWVANPGKCSRVVKRWASPRALESTKKVVGGADRGTKVSPKADLGTKLKKSGLQSKVGVSPSKYKWKASSLQTLPSTSKSAFRWRSEDQKKPPASNLPRAGAAPPPPSTAAGGLGGARSFGDATLSSYKVKSRTKIIKKKGNLGSATDKKNITSSTLPERSLRKKNLKGKTSVTPKRSSPKGLVQITKHRLCRLPATRMQVSTKEGANLNFIRSPRVIKTRYRIVKKNVVSPALSSFSSPVSTWKTRIPLSPRSLLLSQARPSPQGGKSQHVQQRWRSKGYRCIGGVMYRVSANKLSKTSNTPGRARDLSTKSPGRAAGRSHCMPSPGFSPSSCLNRSATSRYIASRAVQRSLAIIRQAKQKKQKKEYCMYYNRFGKCNRGDSCPYIHDPEKVAVCTRFLRGTCKKTDGTCSFSHKVSKDKMPVCSYFLKGICSNSNCPYSHVYVSRKAEVCQDFLKGYCPMGEKCKKKHTLVCPDFAKKGVCPRGAKCKLLHPQKRRHPREAEDGDRSDPPSKWRRVPEETGRDDSAQLHDDGEIPGPSSTEEEVKFWKAANTSPTSWLQKLPSFISLQSPASSSDQGCKLEKDEEDFEDEPGSTKRKRTLPPASSQDSENPHLEEGGKAARRWRQRRARGRVRAGVRTPPPGTVPVGRRRKKKKRRRAEEGSQSGEQSPRADKAPAEALGARLNLAAKVRRRLREPDCISQQSRIGKSHLHAAE
ncbi:zinc finger CCCH domain-containing protein 3 [Indicator indicator]|uniref:zinc finger CCCH domain-containing protein 3 n=1 Tax=Indicator indicator TaxID=1002788 RepID=UPI0023DF75EB|nr:zinc finger CCCH domain-containing protein 3 [Indicator indicator]